MDKKTRLLIVLIFLGLGAYFLYPTVKWYFFTDQVIQKTANGSNKMIKNYVAEKTLEKATELQALQIEALDQPIPAEYKYLVKASKKSYKKRKEDRPDEWTLRTVLRGFGEGSEGSKNAQEAIIEYERNKIMKIKEKKTATMQLGLDLNGGVSIVLTAQPKNGVEEEVKDTADLESMNFFQKILHKIKLAFVPNQEQNSNVESNIDRAMEILNNRINGLGLTEPIIRKQNSNQILVEIPGEEDKEKIDAFIRGKGGISFNIVDVDATNKIEQYMDNGGELKNDRPVDDSIIAPGLIVLGFYQQDKFNVDQLVGYRAVSTEEMIDGNYIQSVRSQTDEMGKTHVSFTLSIAGGEKFFKLTESNVNNPLAIVMDGKIKAAANITEALRTNVSISGFSQKEANYIAKVLRTASLPIELVVESQQVVGASLGEDTIEAGLLAILIGLVAVMCFMLVYYKGAGVVADIALLLNLLLITATLSCFGMTLTMTSIAGIILNVGMAVDANVIIFERIKEEIRLKKSRSAAIEAGFKKAFWTVMDANITTFIAAIFLSMVGKGPIQGFAVTLSVGILCSLFTAIFVSRLIFDFTTDTFKRQKLSIGWGLYK